MSESPRGEGAAQTIGKDELVIAFSGPAVVANKVYISLTTAGVRLAFAESNPEIGIPVFRAAVLLPFPDAKSLLDVLGQLLAKVKIKRISPEEAAEVTAESEDLG